MQLCGVCEVSASRLEEQQRQTVSTRRTRVGEACKVRHVAENGRFRAHSASRPYYISQHVGGEADDTRVRAGGALNVRDEELTMWKHHVRPGPDSEIRDEYSTMISLENPKLLNFSKSEIT